MTALKEYQRLESQGLWRDTPEGQRREVIVSFGDATLMIVDGRSSAALAHWSLPAVTRLNPGQRPALFAPGPAADESLEIEDETMIAAIGKLHRLIEARRPHPGRLRFLLLGGGLALVLGLGVFWMPGRIVSHTASVVPFAKRQEIGRKVVEELSLVAGAPCASPQGVRALERFAGRVLGPGGGEVAVLPGGIGAAAHLPGGIYVLDRALVEDHETPEVAAGYLIAEKLRAETEDPLLALLDWAGPLTAFRLLTTGELPAAALDGYAETMLSAPPPPPLPDEPLLARFGAAGVPSTPYAYALDVSGEATLGLIEADPFRTAPPSAPVLADGDWVALQGICGE